MASVLNPQVLDQVIVLMALMLVGAAAKRFAIITNDALRWFITLLMSIALPCTIISSFHFALTSDLAENAGLIFLVSLAAHVGLIAVSQLLYRGYPIAKRRIFVLSTAFSNCGFVGYPIAQSLFGDIGVFYASIFTIPFNILVFSYGVHQFGRSDGISMWKAMLNPPMIATTIGILFFLTSLQLPSPVSKTMSALGAMTTPLSLLIIGAMLADTKLSSVLRNGSFYYLSFVKLLLAPLLVFIGLYFFHLDRTMVDISIALVAMPSASLIGVFAQRYNGDSETAARCAFVTTVLSVVTIPAILVLLP